MNANFLHHSIFKGEGCWHGEADFGSAVDSGDVAGERKQEVQTFLFDADIWRVLLIIRKFWDRSLQIGYYWLLLLGNDNRDEKNKVPDNSLWRTALTGAHEFISTSTITSRVLGQVYTYILRREVSNASSRPFLNLLWLHCLGKASSA